MALQDAEILRILPAQTLLTLPDIMELLEEYRSEQQKSEEQASGRQNDASSQLSIVAALERLKKQTLVKSQHVLLSETDAVVVYYKLLVDLQDRDPPLCVR